MLGVMIMLGFLFGFMLALGVLGLLVEWIAYRMEAKERKKVKASVWRLKEKDDQEAS